jgi:hypothetical protein
MIRQHGSVDWSWSALVTKIQSVAANRLIVNVTANSISSYVSSIRVLTAIWLLYKKKWSRYAIKILVTFYFCYNGINWMVSFDRTLNTNQNLLSLNRFFKRVQYFSRVCTYLSFRAFCLLPTIFFSVFQSATFVMPAKVSLLLRLCCRLCIYFISFWIYVHVIGNFIDLRV